MSYILSSRLHVNKTITKLSEDFQEEKARKDQPRCGGEVGMAVVYTNFFSHSWTGTTVEGRTKRAVLPYILGPMNILENYFILSLMLAAPT